MEKDELIRQRQANFRQTNAYAMQNGIILALWSIACQACFVGGFAHPLLSEAWALMLMLIPVVVLLLTIRFRRIVGSDVNFPFGRGFMHAFLTMLYCAVWAGAATFIYMQFFDGGYLFDQMNRITSDPEVLKQMQESGLQDQLNASGTELTIADVIQSMRTIGAGNYAAFVIYTYMLTSPIVALFVGLCSIRRVHYRNQQ